MTHYIIILDATRSQTHLRDVREIIGRHLLTSVVVIRNSDAAKDLAADLDSLNTHVVVVDQDKADGPMLRNILSEYPEATVAYIPSGIDPELTETLSHGRDSARVTPLLPARLIRSQDSARLSIDGDLGWVASARMAGGLFASTPHVFGWGLSALIIALEHSGRRVPWNSRRCLTDEPNTRCSNQFPVLTTQSRVLAVVPHYGCEAWLEECLSSLTSQTRPPDNIVVVDDCSPDPPREIVSQFAEVTLLSVPEHTGPENILHAVMRSLHYDAYLVQDADDWSAVDRLEHSLLEAERTGAEMVGTQEIRLVTPERKFVLQTHPLDVNGAMSEKVGHYVCHGSSLIARSLALRAGGFDRMLHVEADTDFVLRASQLGRIVNLPGFYYYRRIRPNSRTSATGTGHGSTLRRQEEQFILQRAARNAERRRQGAAPDAVIPEVADPVEFRHVLGPPLASQTGWLQ